MSTSTNSPLFDFLLGLGHAPKDILSASNLAASLASDQLNAAILGAAAIEHNLSQDWEKFSAKYAPILDGAGDISASITAVISIGYALARLYPFTLRS